MGSTDSAVTYSDIPQGAKIVSAPQYSDVPQGATVVTAPHQSLSFSGQYNEQTKQWEDTQADNPAPKESADVRFSKSFNRAVTGSSTPQELIQNLGQEWDQIKGEFSQNNGTPDPTQVIKGIHKGMQDLWERASSEWKSGNYTTAEGLIQKANAAVHAVQSGLPIVGPALAQAGDQLSQGNAAGMAGTLAGTSLPLMASGGEAGGVVTNPAPEVSAVSKAINPALAQRASVGVGAGVGGVLGHATGIPGASEVGAVAGAAVGRKFGLRFAKPEPAEVPRLDITPTVPGRQGVPAAQYFAARKAGMSDATARTLSDQAYQDATAKVTATRDAGAPARAAFKTPKEAKTAASEAVDYAIPPTENKALNIQTQEKVDFYLQKGQPEEAKQALVAAKLKIKPTAQELKDYQNLLTKQKTAITDEQVNPSVSAAADMESQGRAGRILESRMRRQRESADANKGSLMTAQEAVDSMPLPSADMETNKMLGYNGRRTIKEATQIRQDRMQPTQDEAMHSPWGVTTPYVDAAQKFVDDLTPILDKSLAVARAKRQLRFSGGNGE